MLIFTKEGNSRSGCWESYVGHVMAWKSVYKWEAMPTLQVGFDVLWN
jgi:hypothetical protein